MAVEGRTASGLDRISRVGTRGNWMQHGGLRSQTLNPKPQTADFCDIASHLRYRSPEEPVFKGSWI